MVFGPKAQNRQMITALWTLDVEIVRLVFAPKGLRLTAQGCVAAALPWVGHTAVTTPTGLRHHPQVNPTHTVHPIPCRASAKTHDILLGNCGFYDVLPVWQYKHGQPRHWMRSQKTRHIPPARQIPAWMHRVLSPMRWTHALAPSPDPPAKLCVQDGTRHGHGLPCRRPATAANPVWPKCRQGRHVCPPETPSVAVTVGVPWWKTQDAQRPWKAIGTWLQGF